MISFKYIPLYIFRRYKKIIRATGYIYGYEYNEAKKLGPFPQRALVRWDQSKQETDKQDLFDDEPFSVPHMQGA